MTYAKMTLVKRALGAKQAHAKTTVSKVEDAALKAMVRVTLMRYEGRGFNVPNSYPLVASVAELMVGLCMRESNQPRPGVAPGCPQPMLRAQPCVCGAQSVCAAMQRLAPSVFVRGSEDPAKMTYAEMALVKRGLGAKRAHTKPPSERWKISALMVMRCGMTLVRV